MTQLRRTVVCFCAAAVTQFLWIRRLSGKGFRSQVLTLFACLFLSAPAWAQSWNVGYVFVAIGSGQYQVFDNSGKPIGTISNGVGGATAGCAFNGAFNLYTTDFTNSKVVVFDGANSLHPVLSTFSVGATAGSGGSVDPESVTFDSSGNFYVGFADLSTTVNGKVKIVPGGQLEKFNALGGFEKTFTPVSTENRGVDWTDLASNQSTFFYTSEGQKVLKFDAVSNTSSTFAAGIFTKSTDQLFALKLLPAVNPNNSTDLNLYDGTGGLLVADTSNIKRLNGSGTVVQTYTAPNISDWVALALDPNGTSFWAGDGKTGQVFRFNIASGGIEVGPIATAAKTNAMNGICVKGSHQQNIVPLSYSAGTSVQRFAAFGAPGTRNFHTWTATVDTVITPYVFAVSVTEGVAPSRFDEHFCNQAENGGGFGCTPITPPFTPTLTPITYGDQVNAGGTAIPGQPVFYRVENPPPTSAYSGNVLYTIGFSSPSTTSYTPLTCVVNGTPVKTNNPRLFRAPSSPDPITGYPADAGNHQFAVDSTLFVNTNQKLGDPISGTGKTYNDYLVGDRCPSVTGGTATFNSPLRGQTVTSGRVIPVKVTVTDSSGNIISTAVTFPNNIIGSIAGPDGRLEGFTTPGGSFSPFTSIGQSYSANLDTSGLALGLTTICVTSIDQNGTGSVSSGGPGQFSSTCTQITLQ